RTRRAVAGHPREDRIALGSGDATRQADPLTVDRGECRANILAVDVHEAIVKTIVQFAVANVSIAAGPEAEMLSAVASIASTEAPTILVEALAGLVEALAGASTPRQVKDVQVAATSRIVDSNHGVTVVLNRLSHQLNWTTSINLPDANIGRV